MFIFLKNQVYKQDLKKNNLSLNINKTSTNFKFKNHTV